MPYNGKYIPGKQDLYKLSRSKVDFFLNCPRCFYLDRKLGIRQPPGFPFSLNSAVDELLKKEFDYYREIQKPHPYISKLGLNAVPFKHEKMEEWRFNFKGVSFEHKKLGFYLFGAVDDIWIDLDTKELIVADYKATSKNSEITLDEEWQIGYKRQMEFYQFLLKNNGFKVSNTSYFIYCNGLRNEESFNENLKFKVSLIPYVGDNSWIENTLEKIHTLLNQNEIPKHRESCSFCEYHKKLNQKP